MTQPIATAIAGSLPKPAWLAQPEKLWAPWQLSGEALEQAKRDAMRLAVDDPLRAGITVIGDGEAGSAWRRPRPTGCGPASP